MPIQRRVWPASSLAGSRGARPRSPRPWRPRSSPGCKRGQPAVAWTGPAGPMPHSRRICTKPRASRSVPRRCGCSASGMACAPIARPTGTSKRPLRSKRGLPRTSRRSKKAAAGELVLLSPDEARFSMSPTLRTTLGLTGHRPIVGHLAGHDLVYVFGALNRITGQLTTRLVERPRASGQRQKPTSGQRCLQERCARHLRDIARAYPAAEYPRVVLVIDNAPWHRGALITQALTACPHLEFYRLPSYSPQLQVIERFWRVLRRRATQPSALFDAGPA